MAPPPLQHKIFSISCSFLEMLAKSYVCTPWEGERPLLQECWIRRCKPLVVGKLLTELLVARKHLVDTKHLASIKMLTDLTYLTFLPDLTIDEKLSFIARQ